MRILNTQQMREADRRTIDEIGIPSIVLMENAGRQAVAAMEAAFDDLASSKVGVLCGRGSNGGDGFVIARTLVQRGIDAAVFLLGSVAEVRGDARTTSRSSAASASPSSKSRTHRSGSCTSVKYPTASCWWTPSSARASTGS
jgi:ADP-dependent NAD(P)H-hydrate dehydratase / NAD(P)H-hydrate epimerase